MAKKTIKAQMKQRRDTKANWAATNPVLLDGELGIVSDDPNLYKVGDGATAWNSLPFRGFDGTLAQELGTSPNAVISQKVVSENLTELAKNAFKDYFIGGGSGYVRNEIYGLIPGHAYTITLKSTEWDLPSVAGQPLKFGVHGWKDGAQTQQILFFGYDTTLSKQYTFIMPEDVDYIAIGGRATAGTKVWYNLDDVTDTETIFKSIGVSVIRGINIDTVNKVIDFGSDAVLVVGNKSYLLQDIHSDTTKYRNIPYYVTDSGANIIVFNLDTKEVYAKKYDQARAKNEVVIGTVGSAYQTHEFQYANFPFSYKVDGKMPWVKDVDNVQNNLDELAKNAFKDYFIGGGSGYVRNEIYGLIPGHAYTITLKSTEWDLPSVAGQPLKFGVHGWKDGAQTQQILFFGYDTTLSKQYTFIMPEDVDYIAIGGRATAGTKVWYNLDDVTLAKTQSNDWDAIVKGINHRGWHAAPENTLPAFKQSKLNGFNYVECDISFTSDNVAVLLHDTTIDRTSNGEGAINSLTYEQVLQYDFGSWKGEAYADTKIPTLAEFLTLCRNIGLHPYLEIKNLNSIDNVDEIVSIVKANGMRGKVTYISFGSSILSRIKELDDTARLGFLVDNLTESTIDVVKTLHTGKNEVFVDASAANTDFSLCIAESIPVEQWTFNSESSIINASSYVSGFTSDLLVAGKVLYENSIQ